MSSSPFLDPVVAVAWGLEDRTRRGPKPSLTLDEIVETAVAIADEEGLAAVSMARVAKMLGFTTMSLYRYVGSKEELLRHMFDTAHGYPPKTEPEPTSWREGLWSWSRSMLERQLSRPWVVEIPITEPPLLPRNIAWMEWAMSFLNRTPLTPLEKVSALLLLSGYIRNEVSLATSLNEGGTEDEAADYYFETLGRLVGPESHPALTRLIDEDHRTVAPPEAEPADEDDFMLDFGLQRILDGIEKLIEGREAQRRATDRR